MLACCRRLCLLAYPSLVFRSLTLGRLGQQHESRLAKDALLVCASLHSQLSQQAMLQHSDVWNILVRAELLHAC